MTYNGTTAPVRRTIWEPARTDNPFAPPVPEPDVSIPDWLRKSAPVPECEPEPVPARREGVPV